MCGCICDAVYKVHVYSLANYHLSDALTRIDAHTLLSTGADTAEIESESGSNLWYCGVGHFWTDRACSGLVWQHAKGQVVDMMAVI